MAKQDCTQERMTCGCGLCHASEFKGMMRWQARMPSMSTDVIVARRCLLGHEPYADEYDGHCPRKCGDRLSFDAEGKPVALAMVPKAMLASDLPGMHTPEGRAAINEAFDREDFQRAADILTGREGGVG